MHGETLNLTPTWNEAVDALGSLAGKSDVVMMERSSLCAEEEESGSSQFFDLSGTQSSQQTTIHDDEETPLSYSCSQDIHEESANADSTIDPFQFNTANA
jgi:hypothetical protein